MHFKDYYPLESFKSFLNEYNKDHGDGGLSVETTVFSKAILSFLIKLNEVSPLSIINFSEGHNIPFANFWNKIVKSESIDEDYLYCFTNTFSHLLRSSNSVFELGYPSKEDRRKWSDDDINKLYNKLIKQVNDGNIESCNLKTNSSIHQCSDCAQELTLDFKNWVGKYLVNECVLDENNRHVFKDGMPESCLPKGNISIDVSFQTGEIYFADWFNIPEFTSVVEDKSPDKYSNKKSINFKPGIVYSVKRYAEEFGFISVNVGNSSPKICLDENDSSIAVGYLNEDEKDKNKSKFKFAGSICTDIWNATLIDKQQLINIVAQKTGEEKAIEIVTKYLKEDNIEKIIIPAGNYRLTFNPSVHLFEENLKNDESIYPSNLEKFFTIKKINKPTYRMKK